MSVVISGIGVSASIGQGATQFTENLLAANSVFGLLKREGRQLPEQYNQGVVSNFVGAEIESLQLSEAIPKRVLRTASLSGQVALATLEQAWLDSGLDDVDPERIGLIVGGSNFQQRELLLTQEKYRDRPQFLKPNYGHVFMDSDLCGLCTEIFGIKGFSYTLGSASASGQVAILHAVDAVKSGKVDSCIVLGALMDLSFWEIQAFRSMGAMGSDRYGETPALASRPFDKNRDGFIYGESCGAIVVETESFARARCGDKLYARCLGGAVATDANRNPNPSLLGEVRVIKAALAASDVSASEIDYINPHGTGSKVGDETELKALLQCKLNHAAINSTKSIIGHGLSSAGAVEVIATLLQMKASLLHPCRNLDDPIDDSFNWVKEKMLPYSIKHALTLSMGFGGVNSALCLQAI